MGSYGIGIERILTSVIEQNHDDNGFWLSPRIAPFEVIVVPTNMADAQASQRREEKMLPNWKRLAWRFCWMTVTSVPGLNSRMRT